MTRGKKQGPAGEQGPDTDDLTDIVAPRGGENLSLLFRWRLTIRDSDLDPMSKLVAFVLSMHMDSEGTCWPGVGKLAKGGSIGASTVRRHLRDLEERGYLSIVQRPLLGRRWLSNYYSARTPHVTPSYHSDSTPLSERQYPPVTEIPTSYHSDTRTSQELVSELATEGERLARFASQNGGEREAEKIGNILDTLMGKIE